MSKRSVVAFHLALVLAMFSFGLSWGSIEGFAHGKPDWNHHLELKADERAKTLASLKRIDSVPILEISVGLIGRTIRVWWELVGIAPFSAGYWASCQLH